LARARLRSAEVPFDRRAGKLSGGQRAQVALALAVAKRPRVLLLDEPLAALDPLARRAFLRNLLDSSVASDITVVLSSHLLGDLARVCDHLVVIRDGQIRLTGELDQLLGEHHWIAGAPEQASRLPNGVDVLAEYRHERHTRLLVRARQPVLNPALKVEPVDLEELILAYLERPARERAGLQITREDPL
jgi:ABC-2 type transport system ATP-binding protein